MKKIAFYGVIFFILLYLGNGFFKTISTYRYWKIHPLYKYLLPPYNPSYFYHFSFFYFFLNSFICFFLSGITFFLFYFFYKRRLSYFYESFLSTSGVLASGWPNLLIFFPLIFLIAFFFLIWQNYRKEKKKRISLTLPIILALIFSAFLAPIANTYFNLKILKI